MAEALAVVASGVAVVQLASQAVSGIVKLKSLLDEIKDVPPMIAHLMQELEILIPLTNEVETIQAGFPAGTSADTTLKLCIQHCRTSSQAVADMAASLAQNVNSTKRRRRLSASLKVVLDKNILAKLERDLAGTIRLLMLAQQFYMTAVLRHNQCILASIDASTRLLKQHDCLDNPCQQAVDCQKGEEGASSRATLKRKESASGDKWQCLPHTWMSKPLGLTVGFRWATGTYHAHLACSRWIASCAWDLQVARASTGWQISIKSHPVRPRDSQPFVYIRDKNLNGLLECFKRGEASPFDKDIHGWSLVHHAALTQQVEICMRLFDMGVDVNERTNSLMTVLRCFDSSNPIAPPSQDHIDFMRFLLSRGGEYERYADEPSDQQLSGPYQGTAESFSLLQSHLFPHYYNDTLQTRLLCALQIALNPWRTAEEFRVSLHQHGEISGKDVTESEECQLPILNIALLGLSIRLQSPAAVHDVPDWQSLVYLVLSRSQLALDISPLPLLNTSYVRSACTGQILMATPLFCVIIGTLKGVGHTESCWKLMVGNAVQLWAETVRGQGADVERYGCAEQADFKNKSRHNWFHLGRKTWTTGLARLEHVSIGSQVDDWNLLWHGPTTENPGQGDVFGRSQEQCAIPGSWVEDNLPERSCLCD